VAFRTTGCKNIRPSLRTRHESRYVFASFPFLSLMINTTTSGVDIRLGLFWQACDIGQLNPGK